MDSSARSLLRAWALPGALLLTVVIVASACSSGSSGSGAKPSSAASPSISNPVPLQDSYEAVVRSVLPSVVQISADNSTGSGVVYDNKGDIVTNEHVVGSAKTVEVLPASGVTTVKANVIGVFKPDDLAVLRVDSDADTFKPAKFGNSNDATIGEIVLAMGNPLGLTDSVTQGIVSATGRVVSANDPGTPALITSAIQTSAAINPGNSGGALVDLEDEVIGIPTLAARLPDAGGAAPGIGFAIPSNTVRTIADQIIKSGKVTNSGRAWLGISAQTAANQSGQDTGVAVVHLDQGGAAQKAGLKPGDIVTAIDGKATPNLATLDSVVAMYKPGQKVTLTVVRDGKREKVTATLGSIAS
jgi:putative serine protease PepD